MNSTFRPFVGGLFILVGIALAGCGGTQTAAPSPSVDQHDHEHEAPGDGHEHAHPESFAETLKEVEELRAEIQTAFAAGDLAKADGPVHAVGHLLEELPELAAKESLSEAEQHQVKQSIGRLMDSFAALDERVHGGDGTGKSYDEVAVQIDAALDDLKSVGKKEPTS